MWGGRGAGGGGRGSWREQMKPWFVAPLFQVKVLLTAHFWAYYFLMHYTSVYKNNFKAVPREGRYLCLPVSE